MTSLFLTASAARSDPARLLRTAEHADQHVSYTGIRVVQASSGRETTERRVRVWHQAPDRTRTEYMSPDGGNMLLECGPARWFYSAPRGRWRAVEWHARPPDLDLLLRNYRVRQQGSDTVAGRPVVQLSIEPRHPGNPEKRVWIDRACRMVLREEVRAADGHVVARSRFEEFSPVHELPPHLFDPPEAAAVSRDPPALPFAALRPRYLPAGYQEVRHSGLRRGPGQGVLLLYTDGLGAISLFEFRGESGREPGEHAGGDRDRRHGERPEGGRRGEREENEHGRRGEPQGAGPARLTRKVGDLLCRVMGDIAPDELHKMLDSLPDRP